MSDERFDDFLQRRYHTKRAEVVARLRSLADEVEREGAQTTNSIDSPAFGWAAYKALHAVTWAVIDPLEMTTTLVQTPPRVE